VLFRMLQANGGANYQDYQLVRRASGDVAVCDLYMAMSGEESSQTMRRALLPVFAHADRGLVDRLTGKESEYIRNLPKIVKFYETGNSGQYREALRLYSELPEGIQKDWNLLILRLRYAQGAGEAEYKDALGAIENAFPDDPSKDLVMIDAHFYRKDFAKIVECASRLERRLGGDAHLASIQVVALGNLGRMAEARALAESAMKSEPDLPSIHWAAVKISLDEKNYKETARLLLRLEKDLGVGIADLTTLPDYAGFVKSAEYGEWLAERKK